VTVVTARFRNDRFPPRCTTVVSGSFAELSISPPGYPHITHEYGEMLVRLKVTSIVPAAPSVLLTAARRSGTVQ
jgi:hypothetical protein